MTIGLLGGSFNPIHNAHLVIAKAAVEQGFVEEVWFIPTYIHPLKNNTDLAKFSIRLKLINKAINDIPCLKAYDFEKRLKNTSYTAKLMKYLYQKYPQHKFKFIIGYDILPELYQWFDYSWLKDNVEFLVINRNSRTEIPVNQVKLFQFLKIEPVEISSTQIRDLVKKHEPIHQLVPEVIEKDVIEIYSN